MILQEKYCYFAFYNIGFLAMRTSQQGSCRVYCFDQICTFCPQKKSLHLKVHQVSFLFLSQLPFISLNLLILKDIPNHTNQHTIHTICSLTLLIIFLPRNLIIENQVVFIVSGGILNKAILWQSCGNLCNMVPLCSKHSPGLMHHNEV